MELEPYLFFSGNCEEALNFYKKIFGGEITALMRWKDAPAGSEMSSNGDGNKVMNANFKSPSVKFMAADARPTTQYGDGRISLALGNEDPEEAKRVYKALSEGGKIEQPLEKMFWGALFAMFTDKYGIDWMINCQVEQPVPTN